MWKAWKANEGFRTVSKEVFDNLTPYVVKEKLNRYGNQKRDGGYILIPSELQSSSCIYSLGIGKRPDQIEFDRQMAQGDQSLGLTPKKVYMFDGTINGPCIKNENFVFTKQNIDSKAMFKALENNNHLSHNNLTAQIDIEYSEWEMFSEVDERFFDVFSQFSVEFHGLLQPTDQMIKALKKLSERYYAFHIHLNNWITIQNGILDGYPSVIEVSYIRKDRLDYKPERYTGKYPDKDLDVKNNPKLEDPDICWWN